jgi:hypothetical protein
VCLPGHFQIPADQPWSVRRALTTG